MRMKFCDKCRSYMQRTIEGFVCPRCGNEIQDRAVEVRRIERPDSSSVDIVGESEEGRVKVDERCPECGNVGAFRRVSFLSGEHAGIRQERSVEHLRCAKCSYSWTKS
jgi:DNA-directed RNA polymerase subunit M/transcription elongation factor TFIIS